MTPTSAESRRNLRWSVYLLLIAVGTGNVVGRIFAVNSVDLVRLEQYRVADRVNKRRAELIERGVSGDALADQIAAYEADVQRKLRLERPFLSGNDRSRWLLMRALVEHGTYEIDTYIDEPGWDTIDMVKHPGRDGTPHLYSSKPPLVPTIMAGGYWVIHQVTGKTLGSHPYEIGRTLLIVYNVVPLIVFWLLLARIVERIGRSDWSRLFVMAGATMGTFLTTFAVVLNNHLHAAVCAMIVLYALVHIWLDDRRSPWLFRAAGFFAAMLVANELPGLALAAAVTVGLAFRFPRQTALHFVPAAALVAVAFFGLNYVAHESLRPPYAHRSKTDPDDDWYRYEFTRRGTTVKSYWHDPKGIDAGEPSAGRYALHVLIGHHGIFSLTPMWILSIVGLAMMMRRRDDDDLRPLALLAGTVSIAVIGFYLLRPQVDRNYGGMTSGFRWVYWLAPLWLAAMLPALDRAARSRTLRIATALLLGLSVLSASYPTWNPWTHPWLMNLALYLE